MSPSGEPEMRELARSVRAAQRKLGSAAGSRRSAALKHLATLLGRREQQVLEANRADVEEAQKANLAAPLLRRLERTEARLATLAEGVRQLAQQPDPIGRVVRRTELDDGLELRGAVDPLPGRYYCCPPRKER